MNYRSKLVISLFVLLWTAIAQQPWRRKASPPFP